MRPSQSLDKAFRRLQYPQAVGAVDATVRIFSEFFAKIAILNEALPKGARGLWGIRWGAGRPNRRLPFMIRRFWPNSASK